MHKALCRRVRCIPLCDICIIYIHTHEYDIVLYIVLHIVLHIVYDIVLCYILIGTDVYPVMESSAADSESSAEAAEGAFRVTAMSLVCQESKKTGLVLITGALCNQVCYSVIAVSHHRWSYCHSSVTS